MVGSMASDDPEGREYFQKTYEYADNDPDIKILSNLNNVGAIEVNAFQSQSDVCLQKSIREGFGLTVDRGAVEGPADRPPATSAASRCRSRTGSPASSSIAPSSAPSAASRSSNDPGLGRSLGREGKEHAPPRVPLAAAAARLASVCSTSSTPERKAIPASAGRHRVTICGECSSSPLIIVSNRGPAQVRARRGRRAPPCWQRQVAAW